MIILKPGRALAFVLLWSCWSQTVQGQPDPAQNDSARQYTHTIPLTFSGKDALIQLRLPREVYMHARSADLNDVRLFDAHGKPVPFALINPPSQQLTSHRMVAVKLFPLMGDGGAEKTAADVEVGASPDGTLVSVRARLGTRGGGAETLKGLVMDLRQSDNRIPVIDALVFTLPHGVTNYSARVMLDVSDDLKEWSTVGEAHLSWLTNSATETLANDRIEFDARAFRYARLSWSEGKPLGFAGVSAQLPQRTETAPVQDSLLLEPEPGRFEGDLLYRAARALPIQRIGLKFQEQNIVMPALIGRYVELPSAKRGVPNTWQFEAFLRTTFYQLTQSGNTRTSPDVASSPKHAGEWVVRAQGSAAGKPALRIGWWPASMIFVANGAGPYTLAVGRDGVDNAQVALADVAPGFTTSELFALEHARAGPALLQHNIADEPSEADKAGQAAGRKTALLWAVLLLGLLVLAAMSWGMVKQIRNTGQLSGGDDSPS